MPSIDDLLGHDDSQDNNRINKSKNPTKDRLQSLKELLDSDPIKLNTDNLLLNPADMPQSQNIKVIDYVGEEKPRHKIDASRIITNIVKNYIKSPKLLESPRLLDLVDRQVDKYARLLLLTDIAERNFLTLQEAIDSGDMSTEVFDTNMRAQDTLSKHETNSEKHLAMCENYWANYAEQYGMENEETKIVQETEVKTDEQKRMIMSATEIIDRIRGTVAQRAEDDKADKKAKAKDDHDNNFKKKKD
jgi:hypothetical protein